MIKGNTRLICNATVDLSGNATTIINSGANSELIIEGNREVIEGQNGKLEQRDVSTEYKNEGTGARVEIRGNKDIVQIKPGEEFKEHSTKKGFVNEGEQNLEYSDNEQNLKNVSGVAHNRDTRVIVKKTWFNIVSYKS